ncbi:hypothetical protein TEA_002025 [Camellia sinensis var. sinensis]|uniref:Endoplasmic reticulum vesicle transporter C-terminal domain-containing protein n=1 Tax=Camellia sinensis var. sinensis TaxID=542762 RepID=A0A4V3WIQ6_CAMSN|nr:hypothetical protein TEA_002025 [Camellia sinensis var. sinensis]
MLLSLDLFIWISKKMVLIIIFGLPEKIYGDKDNHEDSDQKNHLHGFDQDAETMIKKVKQALANGEGCRVYGVLDVQRVAGNFHISVHGLNIFIVPIEYRYLSKEVLPTNQFSVTEYYSPTNEYDRTWPAVYFLYDLSPITVTIREERRSFLHFITRLCAVLGGTFALTEGPLSAGSMHASRSLPPKPPSIYCFFAAAAVKMPRWWCGGDSDSGVWL